MNSNKMSDRRTVVREELAWHESEAWRRYSLDAFLYDPPAFDAVVRPAIEFLNGREGEFVLDLGCGEGKETLELALSSLRVVGIDLSYLQLLRARELMHGRDRNTRVHLVQASAEALPFAADSFRLIYGKAILHHLDLDIASVEIGRILKHRGRGTFAEPLAHHPLFRLSRLFFRSLRTKHEHPLSLRELERFGLAYHYPKIDTHFLISPCAYLFRLVPALEGVFLRVHALLSKVDRALFRRFPVTRKVAWYGVIQFQHQEEADCSEP